MLNLPLNPADWEAVILDLDGTLVDTLGDFAAAIAGMLQNLGLPALPASAIEPMVGKGTEHLLRSVLSHVAEIQGQPLTEAQLQERYPAAWERYEHHYLAINGQFSRLYPGVEEGVYLLHATGLPLVCVTNKPLAFAEPLLQAKGLRPYFTAVYGGDSFARKKPDPLPLISACDAVGAAPQRTLMVGDSGNDALAARAAGCPVALLRYGYNHGQPIEQVDADAYLDQLVELVR